jgi:hypothetical protein
MAVRIEVTSQSLIVSLTGLDVVWALKRRLVIDRRDIVSVKLMERKEAIKLLKFRLWGSYLPGAVCAGTFSVGKKAGLPPGSRASQVLVITTSNTRPGLVVLEAETPEQLQLNLS